MRCRSGDPWGDLFSKKIVIQRCSSVQGRVLRRSTIWLRIKYRIQNTKYKVEEFSFFFEWENWGMFFIRKNCNNGLNQADLTIRFVVHENRYHSQTNIVSDGWQNASPLKISQKWIKLEKLNSISVGVQRWWQKWGLCWNCMEFQRRKYSLSSIKYTPQVVPGPRPWEPFSRDLLWGILWSFSHFHLLFLLRRLFSHSRQ